MTYLKPKDIPITKAAKILNRLNSFDSPMQLWITIHKRTKRASFHGSDANRVLNTKTRLGGFRDLTQLMSVRGIGLEKFNQLVRALDD